MTFECATNMNGYGLFFVTYPSVTGPASTGNGIASLNLTATSEVNGTCVTCHATNEFTTIVVTAPAYVYVQGQCNAFIYCKYYYFLPDGQ